MTTKTKPTTKVDRRVAKLERELVKARKEIALLNWMHWQALFAAREMMELPDDEKRFRRALYLYDYIKHLGWHIHPDKGFKECPRLPGIKDYLAEA